MGCVVVSFRYHTAGPGVVLRLPVPPGREGTVDPADGAVPGLEAHAGDAGGGGGREGRCQMEAPYPHEPWQPK